MCWIGAAGPGNADILPTTSPKRSHRSEPLMSAIGALMKAVLKSSSPLRKVILIRPLQHIRLAGGDADAVVDHEFGEAGSVDEDDLLADLGDVVAGGFGEPSGARQTAVRQPEG